jgi:hypothetical protein
MSVSERVADGIHCLTSRESQEFGQHGSGGNFDKYNMVEANFVECVSDLGRSLSQFYSFVMTGQK